MKEVRVYLAALFIVAGVMGFIYTAIAATIAWGWHVWVMTIPLAVIALGLIMAEEK